MNDYREASKSMPAHTQGPWEAVQNGARGIQINSKKVMVCTVPFCDETGFADARLIAAAPEMFEALLMAEQFMAGFEGDKSQECIDEKVAILQGLIAKVGGNHP